MLNGSGFINLMWMFVGIWMGLLLARAVPDYEDRERQAPTVHPSSSER